MYVSSGASRAVLDRHHSCSVFCVDLPVAFLRVFETF
ncbi:unnamed protein product [Penicillium roqueforti FM164]|uniref:Genomic scaffold, ProqFM164S02 n=1 Tax=Penicillium roqueforti (strain FM164) TaxID=1365484 RepID=W6Q6Q3_PENRF|nr:unnamed protein product [Penicillium roqueforti FM164]